MSNPGQTIGQGGQRAVKADPAFKESNVGLSLACLLLVPHSGWGRLQMSPGLYDALILAGSAEKKKGNKFIVRSNLIRGCLRL